MQMKGVQFIRHTNSLVSPGLIKQPIVVPIVKAFSPKKKFVARTSGSLSCKCQLSPLPTAQPSNLEISHHDALLKSVVLPQGMVSHLAYNDKLDPSTMKCTTEELVVKIKKALQKPSSQSTKMKLVDEIQRLGVDHHFEEEIRILLEEFSDCNSNEDLFDTALRFRLLRQNGLPTSSDVFDKFMDKNGKFKESLKEDVQGMLSLYEASYLSAEGDDKLLKAMEFTRSHLKQATPSLSPQLQTQVAKSLELPRHLRMATLEVRSYIDDYSRESNHNPALLEVAKSDFRELQSLHKKELAEIIWWWKQLGLVEKLGFARDRPFECFLWTVGIFPEASYSNIRIELTKTVCVLLVLDDIYDTYGSLDELILFNDAIKRWDLRAMEQLPDYMKICYMALYNTTNEIAYRVLKEHGWCIADHLKRTWIDIFDAFLAESKWFNTGYTPTLEQYLTNGVTSGGSYMALVHAFFLIGHGVTDETVSMMQPYPELFSCSGKILRLWDDLGTATEEKERGDVASSIECYMRENNVEMEDEARKHIKQMIRSLWMELNGHLTAPTALPRSMTKTCFNLARTAQIIYQHGDDNRFFSVEDHVQSLFFKPCA